MLPTIGVAFTNTIIIINSFIESLRTCNLRRVQSLDWIKHWLKKDSHTLHRQRLSRSDPQPQAPRWREYGFSEMHEHQAGFSQRVMGSWQFCQWNSSTRICVTAQPISPRGSPPLTWPLRLCLAPPLPGHSTPTTFSLLLSSAWDDLSCSALMTLCLSLSPGS